MLHSRDDWKHSIVGISKSCTDGVASITSGMRELERNGYVVRRRLRNEKGQITSVEYSIFEDPTLQAATPDAEIPQKEIPHEAAPFEDTRSHINTKETKTKETSTNSLLSSVQPEETEGVFTVQSDRAFIMENIGYEGLLQSMPEDEDAIHELLELIVETVSARRSHTRVAGADFPHEVVRSRFLKLNADHIRFVLSCLHENTTQIRNIKAYLLTALYNAPTTITHYYNAEVNHDLYGQKEDAT